jgi:hypothetical protein
MNQHHPRQDGSGGHAGTRSGITRQDLIRKARHVATRHRPKACEALTPAAGRLHRRQLEKMAFWTGRERLRFWWYRLRLTVREMNTAGRTVRLGVNGRAIATVHPAGSQMTTASTGLATMAHQELAATPRAAVTRPGDRGHYRMLQSWGPRC